MRFIYPITLVLLTITGILLSSAQPQGLKKKQLTPVKVDTVQLKIDSLGIVIRNLQAANDRLTKEVKQKDSQLTAKAKQVTKLTADNRKLKADTTTLNGVIDVCVESYTNVIGKLNAVLNITASKKLPRRKVKDIELIIEKPE